MVKQQHLHLTTVVGIDNTGTSVDKVLRGQTTPGSDTAICKTNTNQSASTFTPNPAHTPQFGSHQRTSTLGHSHRNTSINQRLAFSRHHRLLRSVHIVPRRKSRAPRRGLGRVNQLLDQQRGQRRLDRSDGGCIRGSHVGVVSCFCALGQR